MIIREGRTRSTRSAWTVAGCLAVFSVLTLGGAADLAAQAPLGQISAEDRAALDAAAAADPLNFTGYWGMPGYRAPEGHGFEARIACAALTDPSGAPMERCKRL